LGELPDEKHDARTRFDEIERRLDRLELDDVRALSVSSAATIHTISDPTTAARIRAVIGATHATEDPAGSIQLPRIRLRRSATTLDRILPSVLATDRRPLDSRHIVLIDQTAEREIRR